MKVYVATICWRLLRSIVGLERMRPLKQADSLNRSLLLNDEVGQDSTKQSVLRLSIMASPAALRLAHIVVSGFGLHNPMNASAHASKPFHQLDRRVVNRKMNAVASLSVIDHDRPLSVKEPSDVPEQSLVVRDGKWELGSWLVSLRPILNTTGLQSTSQHVWRDVVRALNLTLPYPVHVIGNDSIPIMNNPRPLVHGWEPSGESSPPQLTSHSSHRHPYVFGDRPSRLSSLVAICNGIAVDWLPIRQTVRLHIALDRGAR